MRKSTPFVLRTLFSFGATCQLRNANSVMPRYVAYIIFWLTASSASPSIATTGDSVLTHIEQALEELIALFNKRVPTKPSDVARTSYETCFVRAGEKKKGPGPNRVLHEKLSAANDWKILVDYEHSMMVFPPEIYATSLRPDIVIWSRRTTEVILIELTVCAEEGINAAQLRKEARYTELLEAINATKCWHATLATLEIGARGLVHSTTFRTFTDLGFPAPQANKLCKSLSAVAARCSYAIFMAHKSAPGAALSSSCLQKTPN